MALPRPEDLEITQVPLEELDHWPGNARRGVTSTIVDSMRNNGVFNPLVVQKNSNRIIIGNHRWEALKVLHAEDPEKWGDKAPVMYLDVSDSRANKINLADNKTSDDAEWDDRLLVEQLAEIVEEEGTLEGTGFEDDEFDSLQALLTAPEWTDQDKSLEDALDEADRSAWPIIRVQVDPSVAERYWSVEGPSEEERFLRLLNMAGI